MSVPYEDPNYNPYPPSVLIGTAVLFMITSILSVGLRFYARFLGQTPLGIDDWITIPSMVTCRFIGNANHCSYLTATTAGGLGSHQELVGGELSHTTKLYIYEKTRYAYEVIGSFGLCITKLSVLFFFRRLFQVRPFYIVNNILIGVTIAWGIAYTVSTASQCTPISTIWDRLETEYRYFCLDIFSFYLLSYAASDLMLDLIIFTLPLPMLWQLRMPWRKKLAVAGIFLLGSIAIASSITRVVVYNWAIFFARAEPQLWSINTTWYSTGLLFWHLAENAVGLLSCCLPSYAPLFQKYATKSQYRTCGRRKPADSLWRCVGPASGS
ncbi:hypothetical protein F5X99DRAFT_424791 [Biscogniauxia marginata]|nr:hypothetical protein F5X99DRAFT_424791 [Biscogniauxia marginata]